MMQDRKPPPRGDPLETATRSYFGPAWDPEEGSSQYGELIPTGGAMRTKPSLPHARRAHAKFAISKIAGGEIGAGVIGCAQLQQRRSAIKVKSMHKGVEWVGPETPISELAKLMRKNDIGAIPIGENDKLIGMVTDRDIVCNGIAADGFDARKSTARNVMTPGIHCCREDDDLPKAVEHMEKLRLRRLPVINKSKRMVGILGLGDVCHAAQRDQLTECIKSVSAHHH
jgi:CBS domain-containing protein